MRDFFVYILASPSRTLYVGVTGDLERRVYEHKHKLVPGFTAKYGVTRLVHMETYAKIDDAIAREKEIKGWRREKKLALIETQNPKWCDLKPRLVRGYSSPKVVQCPCIPVGLPQRRRGQVKAGQKRWLRWRDRHCGAGGSLRRFALSG